MVQIVSDVKEAWRRASYADYDSVDGGDVMTVKNKFATRTRLFVSELKLLKARMDEESFKRESSD